MKSDEIEVNIEHKYLIVDEIFATSKFRIRDIKKVDVIEHALLGKCYKIYFKDYREIILPIEGPVTELDCFINNNCSPELSKNERLLLVIKDVKQYIQHNNLSKDKELEFILHQLYKLKEEN